MEAGTPVGVGAEAWIPPILQGILGRMRRRTDLAKRLQWGMQDLKGGLKP